MAINATRGLPSFSEMYEAFKNKGSLGDAINAGVKGYETGQETGRKNRAQESQSILEKAQAEKALHDAQTPKEQYIRLDQIVDPTEKNKLAQYATPDEQGILKISKSVYDSVTKRELGADTVDLKAQLAAAKAAKDAADIQAAQEKLELTGQLGGTNLKERANSSIISGTPEEAPGPMAKVGGLIASGIGKMSPSLGEALTPASIEQARMRQEALKGQQKIASGDGAQRLAALQNTAAGEVLDKSLNIPATDPQTLQAQEILRKNGKPVTPANVAEVLRRMGR